jgi:PD-(D/E)XK nuclease superfamily
MKDPERLDLPSGSSFEIVVECPGQPALKAMLPVREEKPEEPDEDALSGTRIHRARQTGDTSELDGEEKSKYEAGLDYERQALEQWRREYNIVRDSEGPREVRLWLHDPTTGERCLSAQLDVHYVGYDANDTCFVLVVDWKTGWSWNLTPSQRNWQLRCQGVLAWREYSGVRGVRTVFVKPIARLDRVDSTDYNEESLTRSQESIYQRLWESTLPDAERHAGDHCNYCPCKDACREAAAYGLLPSVIADRARAELTEPYDSDPIAIVEVMPLVDVALLHSRARIIGKILDAAKARLKKLDDNTLKSLGLYRKAGRRLDPLVRTKDAFDYLKSFGIKEEAIWRALSFSKGDLVNMLQEEQGWAKEATDGFVRGQLAPFIEKKNAEDSIGS